MKNDINISNLESPSKRQNKSKKETLKVKQETQKMSQRQLRNEFILEELSQIKGTSLVSNEVTFDNPLRKHSHDINLKIELSHENNDYCQEYES